MSGWKKALHKICSDSMIKQKTRNRITCPPLQEQITAKHLNPHQL